MGKHDQPNNDYYHKTTVKLALGAGTVAGVLAFSNAASADTYIVQAEDNLWGIAQKLIRASRHYQRLTGFLILLNFRRGNHRNKPSCTSRCRYDSNNDHHIKNSC
jgi:hypothetical protein